MKTVMITLAAASVFIAAARGQGFMNLDFESAQNLPANPGPGPNGTLVAASSALPGWTAYGGFNVLSSIYYISNSFSGYSSLVQLEGGTLALSGNLSVGLAGDGSISQTGLVPGNAESLQFEASSYVNLQVSLGGQFLSYSTVSQGPDYTVYEANIPADMDGKMEALTFDVNGIGQSLLDNIEFTTSVPEPSIDVLMGMGAMLFGLRRWRNHHS